MPEQQQSTPDNIVEASLEISVDRLAANVELLSQRIDFDRRERRIDRRLRRVVLTFSAFAFVSLMIVTIVGMVLIRSVLSVSHQNAVNGRILVECTTPDNPHSANPADRVHECYNAGRASQSEIIDANHNGVPDTLEILRALGKG